MKKQVLTILIIIILAIAILVLIIYFQIPRSSMEIKFEFSAIQCNESISPYDSSHLGVKEINWKGKNLEVKAFVSINCAEKIIFGSYELQKEKIILRYEKTSCNPCTLCNCVSELSYKFENLEKKDYKFELEQKLLS